MKFLISLSCGLFHAGLIFKGYARTRNKYLFILRSVLQSHHAAKEIHIQAYTKKLRVQRLSVCVFHRAGCSEKKNGDLDDHRCRTRNIKVFLNER
jgi:hypothetical protein